ncbi:hypothetical protein ACQ27_gp675 [Klebsiella phage K64-1]|nr:hypothetical protein ACQ27_gp675 [Klebsiella phage K64-1]
MILNQNKSDLESLVQMGKGKHLY